MKNFIVTEYNLFLMRKNDEFPLVNAVLNYAIKRAKEKEMKELVVVCPDCLEKLDEKNICPQCKGVFEGNPLDTDIERII